jgi:hypothetical protein
MKMTEDNKKTEKSLPVPRTEKEYFEKYLALLQQISLAFSRETKFDGLQKRIYSAVGRVFSDRIDSADLHEFKDAASCRSFIEGALPDEQQRTALYLRSLEILANLPNNEDRFVGIAFLQSEAETHGTRTAQAVTYSGVSLRGYSPKGILDLLGIKP